MKYYFAPLEGISNFIVRNAYAAVYGGLDKYFLPFVAPNKGACFSTKEKRDLNPDNNTAPNLVPQILANNSQVFIETALAIQEMGYSEINLNLGCPSGTVFSKKRGSGFLSVPDQLEAFLGEIFDSPVKNISIKSRLGVEDPKEFERILSIYNKYPITELTIHPRLRNDMYGNKPRLEWFEYACNNTELPLCYNGDLFTNDDINEIQERFSNVKSMMLGRGLLMNPGFIQGDHNDSAKRRAYHNMILTEYQKIIPDDKNTLEKMKELWFYLSKSYPNGDKLFKEIKKTRNMAEYKSVIRF